MNLFYVYFDCYGLSILNSSSCLHPFMSNITFFFVPKMKQMHFLSNYEMKNTFNQWNKSFSVNSVGEVLDISERVVR